MAGKEYTDVTFYFHKIRDADILDRFASLPRSLKGDFVKEAIRLYMSKTTDLIKGNTTEEREKPPKRLSRWLASDQEAPPDGGSSQTRTS